MSSIFVEILKLSFCLTLNCSNKIFLNTKFTLFSFLYVFNFISCHHAKRKSFFLGQHILSKEILKRISFNDLTLLHDVDLKRSLLIWKLFLLCISHLKNENTSCRIFCLLAKWNKVRLNLFDKYWNKKYIFFGNSICLL